MADEIERLLVRIEANATQFEAQMKKVNRTLYGVEATNKRTFERMKRDAAQAGQELGQMLGAGFGRASLLAGAALAGISAYAIRLASDAAEIRDAFQVAFKDSAQSARQFAEALAGSLDRDSVPMLESMTRLQLVITGTGVAAEKSTELVKSLTARAVDVGSLFNVEDAEAYRAMISGLTGETEPLKRFGVVLNEAAVKTELLRLGFKGNTSAASEAAKTIARANIILEKTSVAQGNAARTAGSAANSAKAMKDQFNIAARDLGEILLPHVTKAMQEVTKLVKAFNDMPSGVQIAGLAILAFVAAGGPIAALLGSLGKVIKLAGMARASLMGLTGANAAAGGSGLIGAAGVGGTFGAPLAVAGAGGFALWQSNEQEKRYEGIMKNLGRASEEDLAFALGYTDSNLDRATRTSRVAAGAQRRSRFTSDRGRLLREQMERGLQPGNVFNPDGIRSTEASRFDLPPELLRPTSGSSGGGRGKTGPTKEELAAKAEELRLEQELERARASGDATRIQAAETEQWLKDRTAKYVATGRSQADAEILALTDKIALNREELALVERLASVKAATFEADPQLIDFGLAEAAEGIQANEDEMRETFRRSFGDGVRAALQGDLDGYFMSLADRFSNRLIDNLSDQLFDLLNNYSKQQQGSGSGNWFSSALSWLGTNLFSSGSYAGGFAGGGDFPSGKWATVGEQGPEALYAKPGGGVKVLSNGALRAMRSARPAQGGGGSAPILQFDLRGAVMTEDLVSQMNAIGNVALQGGAMMGGAQAAAASARASARKQATTIPR